MLLKRNFAVFLTFLYASVICFSISFDILISEVKSADTVHNLNISAPYSFTTSAGSMPFPRDLDIFLPSPSTTKPCVNTFLYGAFPFVATDVKREDWNHPLCWSEPSRYRSDGHLNSGRISRTAAWLEPESNHTSIISVSFLNLCEPHFSHFISLGNISSALFLNHASEPSSLNNSFTAFIVSSLISSLPHFSQ